MNLESSALKKNPDQRFHPRFKSFNLIRAIVPGGREIQRESSLNNISEGGLLFYSTENIEANSNIKIHIEIPEFNSSITVGGTVSWVQMAMERANCYFVGVRFIDLKDADKELIRKLKGAKNSS